MRVCVVAVPCACSVCAEFVCRACACVLWPCHVRAVVVRAVIRAWLTSAPSWSSTTRDPSALSESRFTLGPRPSDFPLPFDNLPLLDFFSLGGMGSGTGTAERVQPENRRASGRKPRAHAPETPKLLAPPVRRLELVSSLRLLPPTPANVSWISPASSRSRSLHRFTL